MSDISKLNSAFFAELGTAEIPKGSNNVKYNTEYYGHEVSGDNYPWCCSFIWCVFRKCGLSNVFCGGNKTAYCPFVVSWARQHNQWVTSGYQLGDILLYDWDGDGVADHIGWCAGVAGGYAKSIEGNSSDSVRLNSQPFSKIMGAYRPKYSNDQLVNNNLGSETSISNKTESIPDEYTVKAGDSLWAIGLKIGVPYLEIAKANNISSPFVIHPGQILTIPNGKTSSTSTTTVQAPSIASSKQEETLSGDSYTVKPGDTLWGIATRTLGSGSLYPKIVAANNLKTVLIKPGQVLKIPR